MKLIGIDVGTSALKVTVVDPEQGVLGVGRCGYTPETPRPGWVEMPVEHYWRACVTAVHAAVEEAGGGSTAALAIACQGETLIPVNQAGSATRSAILWLDNRATAEASTLEERYGDVAYAVTGQPRVTPTWPACKILWLRERQPDIFASAHRFVLVEDYLVHRLTGEWVASRSLYSSSLLLDIASGHWWSEMLGTLGLDQHHLPRLADSGDAIGTLTTAAAGELHLDPHTLVVAGGLDQIAAVCAAGLSPKIAVESTGSALAVAAETAKPTFDSEARVPFHVSVKPDRYCVLAWSPSAGMALAWTLKTFFPEARSFAELDDAAAAIEPGAQGLTMLPHFQGTASPDFNPSARAVLAGLSLWHTRAHIARGTLEAIAYDLRSQLELIEATAGPATEVRCVGGGARSDLWLQIKADVIQRPIVALEQSEFACIGAAALAAVGAEGGRAPLQTYASRAAQVRRRVDPNPANAAVYDMHYRRFLMLYGSLSAGVPPASLIEVVDG
jgi:xylulokinase